MKSTIFTLTSSPELNLTKILKTSRKIGFQTKLTQAHKRMRPAFGGSQQSF